MLASWMSTDSSNRVFILGVLTAAAFAGAYIFWGPTPSVRPKRRKGKTLNQAVVWILTQGSKQSMTLSKLSELDTNYLFLKHKNMNVIRPLNF